MGRDLDFENKMDMEMNMDMIFENRYGYEYSSIQLVLASFLSLMSHASIVLKVIN